jgi:uncharacterized protein YgiB involved in biofilm formation
MKRSTAITLVLAGSTTAFALYACNRPKAETYPDVQACVDAGRHTRTECEAAFTQAAREHEQSAPHFQNRADCIATYGPNGCEERESGGGSFFVPLMLGYMLGHGMGYHPLYQGPMGLGCRVAPDGNRYGSCPGGGFFGHGGTGFGGGRGWFGGGSSGASSGGGSETSTVSRGGFGATGHGFGGGGE